MFPESPQQPSSAPSFAKGFGGHGKAPEGRPNNLERQLDALCGIQTNDLKPEVKSYLQNLITQAQGILTSHKDLNTAPIEILEELKALVDKIKYVAKNKDIPLQEKVVSIDKAKEILGNNFYGSEEIENVFGFIIDQGEIPPIPYSLEVLAQAKELGESLILRVSHDNEGNPMTMKHINEVMESRMDKDEEGVLLNDTDWYKDEDFYKVASLKTEWKLVGGSVVPDVNSLKDGQGNYTKDTGNNNYIHQTRILRNYLKSIDSLTEDEHLECSDKVLKQLSKQMGVDWESQSIINADKCNANWKEVALKLSQLPINLNHRRSPAEIIYDWVLKFKTLKDRGILEINYDWSGAVASDGYLVAVGFVGSGGARVGRWLPSDRDGDIGVVSLR